MEGPPSLPTAKGQHIAAPTPSAVTDGSSTTQQSLGCAPMAERRGRPITTVIMTGRRHRRATRREPGYAEASCMSPPPLPPDRRLRPRRLQPFAQTSPRLRRHRPLRRLQVGRVPLLLRPPPRCRPFQRAGMPDAVRSFTERTRLSPKRNCRPTVRGRTTCRADCRPAFPGARCGSTRRIAAGG